jgi:hypothetical protein
MSSLIVKIQGTQIEESTPSPATLEGTFHGAGPKSDTTSQHQNFICDEIFSLSQGRESTPKESAHSSDERLAIATPLSCHAEGTPR